MKYCAIWLTKQSFSVCHPMAISTNRLGVYQPPSLKLGVPTRSCFSQRAIRSSWGRGAFGKYFSSLLKTNFTEKLFSSCQKNFNFMKDILSLISRVQEIKLNQQIGLMDSRIHGCGQPGQQASVAIQGAESICLTTEICFSSLSAPASSSTLWWSNSLAPD